MEVPRRSGLGMGTIYVAVEVMQESVAEVQNALAEEPATWTAFTRAMRHMARLRSSQLFPLSRGRAKEPGPELTAIRARLLTAPEDLVARTQHAGAMREDVTDRCIGVLPDGLRAPGTETLSRPAPGPREIDQFFRTMYGL